MADAPSPGDRRDMARMVGLVLAVLVLLALILDNRQTVRIGYLVGDVKAPLLVVLVITALLGFLVARLLEWRTGRNRD